MGGHSLKNLRHGCVNVGTMLLSRALRGQNHNIMGRLRGHSLKNVRHRCVFVGTMLLCRALRGQNHNIVGRLLVHMVGGIRNVNLLGLLGGLKELTTLWVICGHIS